MKVTQRFTTALELRRRRKGNNGRGIIAYHEIYRMAGCDCDPSYLSQMKNGVREINDQNKHQILKVAKFLKLTEEEALE